MGGTGDRRAAIGDDQGVDVDEQMALVFVIAGNAGAYIERVAGPRRREMLDLATDMHPRPENHVAVQREIADMRHQDGVKQSFFFVERRGFPHVADVLRDEFRGRDDRVDPEPRADGEGGFVGRRPGRALRDWGKSSSRGDGRAAGSEAVAVAQTTLRHSSRISRTPSASLAVTVA